MTVRNVLIKLLCCKLLTDPAIELFISDFFSFFCSEFIYKRKLLSWIQFYNQPSSFKLILILPTENKVINNVAIFSYLAFLSECLSLIHI